MKSKVFSGLERMRWYDKPIRDKVGAETKKKDVRAQMQEPSSYSHKIGKKHAFGRAPLGLWLKKGQVFSLWSKTTR